MCYELVVMRDFFRALIILENFTSSLLNVFNCISSNKPSLFASSSIGMHSNADVLEISRKRRKSFLLLPEPSAIFSVIDKTALRSWLVKSNKYSFGQVLDV